MKADAAREKNACRLGVLAFGDSITNGGGEMQWGVALQSWALWIARSLGIPYTGYAVDGALATDVVQLQIPAFEARNANPDAHYDLGCLYIGVNDVRMLDWDPNRYAAAFEAAVDFLTGRCDRVLALTVPFDLGRPRAGYAKVNELNTIIRGAVGERGALLVDLGDFKARNHVMTDHVHPTAFGQIAIAERALRVLAADGVRPVVPPSRLIVYEKTPLGRLRGDLIYLYRRVKNAVRSAPLYLEVARSRRTPRAGDAPGSR